MKVFIDPGHGGKDRANRGPTGYVEADGVLDMARRLRLFLEALPGLELKMSRETDETVTLYQRSDMANRWGAEIFVSVHTNAAASPQAGGIETYHSLNGEWGPLFSGEAKRLAGLVQRELARATGLADRGVKTRLVSSTGSPLRGKDYYAVIRRTKCPAIIAEVGFHSNPREEALLKTEAFRQTAAQALALGIRRYFHLQDGAGTFRQAGPFKDVPPEHWAAEEIRFVRERGLMDGFEDGTFRPDEPLTRAQLAVILQRLLRLGQK